MLSIQMIPLHLLCNSDTNPRSDLTDIDELGQSVKTFGILQPLVVRQAEGGTYELIAGHRRAAAAAQAGLEEVPCVIRDDAGDLSVHHLVENTQRVDLRPFEIAGGIGLALKSGIKGKALAEHLGRSEAWVSKFKTIATAIEKFGQRKDESNKELFCNDADTAYSCAKELLNPKKVSATKETADENEQADAQANASAFDAIIGMIEKGAAKAKINQPGVVFDGSGGNYAVAIAFDSAAAAKKFFKLLN